MTITLCVVLWLVCVPLGVVTVRQMHPYLPFTLFDAIMCVIFAPLLVVPFIIMLLNNLVIFKAKKP
jgi:hypothetical protein